MNMETKYIKIPFEIDLAKKISNGECEGKIVTRDGRSVRIICWDRKDKDFPIVSLAGNSETECIFHKINGEYCLYGKADKDLMLEVPEYMTFKDGDLYKTDMGSIAIYNGNYQAIMNNTPYYVGLRRSDNRLIFRSSDGGFGNIKKCSLNVSEEERQQLIDALKVSDDPRVKECLRKLGIEEKPKCEFKPFDRVLVRDSDDEKWQPAFFWCKTKIFRTIGCNDWNQCIPYNAQTAHLLGTTDNFEDNK